MAPIMQSAFARAFAPSPDLYAADDVHDGLDPAGDALQEEATSYERECFDVACLDAAAGLIMLLCCMVLQGTWCMSSSGPAWMAMLSWSWTSSMRAMAT